MSDVPQQGDAGMDRSLQGRVCLITGATSGIGKAAAAELAQRGATVILVARNHAKGAAVRDELRAHSGNQQIDLLVADLSSQKDIRALATSVEQRYKELHVLINNAGGIFFRRETTVDGLELTFALDHLAYFLLTNLLLDLLKGSAPARIINISSGAEASGRINFDDLQSTRSYNPYAVYAQAKLANMLFTYALARRLHGSGVTVNAVTPGPVATNFGGSGTGILNRMFPLLFSVIGKPPAFAAATVVELASNPVFATVTGKAFYGGREKQTSPRSHDVALQERLWQLSAELTAVTAGNEHAMS
jgi:NAD(P)-dependent dehydrogenase (short-subunit alcohol dehydrogenase family)